MRATELIERFNEVIRLTQDAWKYDEWLEWTKDESLAKLRRVQEKHAAANAAAKAFCRLLSDNESA
jgi:hypothetical protein